MILYYTYTPTWASGLLAPKDAAPNLTTSANCIMVDTAFWAALASCSWDEAAPKTFYILGFYNNFVKNIF